MNPIRVLHIVGIMDRGGLETLIMNLYRNIDREKVQFDFLVHSKKEGAYDREILKLGGKIYRIDSIRKLGPIKYPKALKNFFKDHKEYNIVHSHMNAMSGVILKSAKQEGIQNRIAHSHSSYPKMGIFEKIYKNYSKTIINKNCTHKFACSKKAAEWLYGSECDVKILNNGIDIYKYLYKDSINIKKRKELNIDNDTLIVGHVGSFREAKNHEFIIKIFRDLKKIHSNVVLVLAGDGELKNTIENEVNVLSLKENVKFLGVRADINELLQMFNILLFPSIYEGLPVTLVEAQASGLRCLLSDTITNEIDMNLNLIKFKSLDKDSKSWAKTAIEFGYDYQRISKEETIKSRGYDIRSISEYIQEFYLNLA